MRPGLLLSACLFLTACAAPPAPPPPAPTASPTTAPAPTVTASASAAAAPAPASPAVSLELPAPEDVAPAAAKCDAGDVAACKQAAETALFGWGVPLVPTLASGWARRACEKDDARACYLAAVASLQIGGSGGAALMTKACRLGDKDACLEYALTKEGKKLPDAAAKKLFGKSAIDLANDACDEHRGDACASQIEDLMAGMRPFDAVCSVVKTCGPRSGGCLTSDILQWLELSVDMSMKVTSRCSFDEAPAMVGAGAMLACKEGKHVCFRASFGEAPLAEAAKTLRDECVTHREARACERLAGKLHGAEGGAGVPEIVVARLIAQAAGQRWRGALEADHLVAGGRDPGERSMALSRAKALLAAGKEPEDATWVRVIEAAELTSRIAACEGMNDAEWRNDWLAGERACLPPVQALGAVDPKGAAAIARRYCRFAKAFCAEEKRLSAQR